jgi:hypothetical protein
MLYFARRVAPSTQAEGLDLSDPKDRFRHPFRATLEVELKLTNWSATNKRRYNPQTRRALDSADYSGESIRFPTELCPAGALRTRNVS